MSTHSGDLPMINQPIDSTAAINSEIAFKDRSFDILDDNFIKLNKKFLLSKTKNEFRKFDNKCKICKIIKFSPEWNFDDILKLLESFRPENYPNLFIFIFEVQSFQFFQISTKKFSFFRFQENKQEKWFKLKNILLKFCQNRPLILQIQSKNENITKFYFKEETLNEFSIVNQKDDNIKEITNFQSFFHSLSDENITNFENKLTEILPKIEQSTLILRFLRILDLPKKFFEDILSKCSESGSISHFCAALDAPFCGSISPLDAQKYIIKLAVLLNAVKSRNTEVINYLITYWTLFIQQLSFDHQIKISTAAFESSQLHILCDLLDIADYPFPDKFDVNLAKDGRLRIIVDSRVEFHNAITNFNEKSIDKFIKAYPDLNIVYNIDNKSALMQSIYSRQPGAFVHLKNNFYKHGDVKLNKDDESFVEKILANERERATQENINNSIPDENKSQMKMRAKTTIDNRKVDEQTRQLRHKFKDKCCADICKVKYGQTLIDTVSQCERLQIIFYFENEYTDSFCLLDDDGAVGTTYHHKKWIFIGAKSYELPERERVIKSTLAHELFHYAMHLVFENSPSKPFYQNSKLIDEYTEIIKELDEWSGLKDEDDDPDDSCNGIISSVYKFYMKAKFPSELIVRPIEMLVYYDNDTEKVKIVEKLYQKLFDFIDTHVIPEMKALNLMEKEDLRHLNYMSGQLTEIKTLRLQLVNLKGIEEFKEVNSTPSTKNVFKVNTNIPKLFLLNNYNRSHPNGPIFFETKNIVVNSNIAKDNEKLFTTYKSILLKYKNLTIFVHCTNLIDLSDLNKLFINKDSHRFILLSLDIDSQEGIIINYNWDDLNDRSQKALLWNQINFQNKKTSWNNLLKKDLKKLSEIINTKFLNILLENSEISINTKHEIQLDAKIDELLYKPRGFVKKDQNGIKKFDIEIETFKPLNNNLTKISERIIKLKQNIQNKFLQVIKNKRHVLISDIPGNGKSQFMKEIAKVVQYEIPRRWVSFVELKEFIEKFNEEIRQNVEFEFSSFMAEKIFKFKSDDIEFIIFKFFYNNGRVFIIFDGFDEIASRTSEKAPNCDKFVLKLAKKFQQNDGNQLCITTRDYFEATLVKELQLDATYSLDNMSESDGTRFIVRYWMLKKEKNFVDVKSMVDYLEHMFESTSNRYMPVAKELVKKVSILKNRSVGLPLLFNMIAVIFKDKFDTAIELKISKIFSKFAKEYYDRWAHDKGLLGKEASTESVEYELNYWKFLQFCAILNLFPDYLIIFFPDNDRSEWSVEAIIAFGLIKIINENYYFSHESFCDYFASDALAKYLKKTKIDEEILKLFADILTNQKYQSIRMFLNDLIENYSVLSKIVPKMSNYMDLFYNMHTIKELFEYGLDNLSDFVIELLNEGDCVKVKEILFEITGGIIVKAVNPEMFTNYKEFLFKKLEIRELDILVDKKYLLPKILESSLQIEIFEEFVQKISPECAIKALKAKHWGGNIFFSLCGVKGKNMCLDKVRKSIEILQTFITNEEIFKLMKYCGYCMPRGYYNILQVCVEAQNEENLRIIWIEIKNFFESPNLPQNFKEFVTEKYALNRNILHLLAKCNKVEFHDCLWEFLYELFPNTVEKRDELKNMILEKSNVGCNFIHDLFNLHKNIDVIKYTLNSLELNFNELQFQEILTLTDFKGMNLLQSAASDLKDLHFFEFLWEIYKKSFKTNENFVKFLNQFDNSSNNLIMIIISASTNEIFNFTMLKLIEITTSRDDVKKMMSHCGRFNRNLLQLAAFCEKIDLHNSLWEVLDMYFESSEILNFITNIDTKGEHFLFDLVCNNTIELVKLTWSKLKDLMDLVHYDKVEFLNIKNLNSQNLAEIYNRYKEKPEICEWVKDLFNEYNIEYDKTCYITKNDDDDLFDYDNVDISDDVW